MDDSHVVSFGPLRENREVADETISERESTTSRNETEMVRDTPLTESATEASKMEMRRLADECILEFTNKMEAVFNQLSDRMESSSRHTPILGRGLQSTPQNPRVVNFMSDHGSRENTNNSHELGGREIINRREKGEISCRMKPQKYDGTDDLEEYLTQFNLLSELNNWTVNTKALFLASSLSGGARALLNEMSDYELHNYEDLVEALKSRYGSVNRAEIFRAELQTRVRMRNETIPELAQAIKKMTRRAYPGSSPVVRDTLSLDYFIDAIPETEIRLRLREVGPKSINEAENIAVRLEALRIADRQKVKIIRSADGVDENPGVKGELNKLKNSLDNLRRDVGNIKNRDYVSNASKRENLNNQGRRNHNGSFDFRRNEHFKRSENGQESSVRVCTRPNQGGPTR